jgi:hypothetical protein
MEQTVSLSKTTHKLTKENLVTITRGNRSYDVMKCQVCGAKGKRFGLGDTITLVGKAAAMAKCPPAKHRPARVRIERINATGPALASLSPGSEHAVIECPERDKRHFEDYVWVEGVSGPVMLLPGEYTPL